MRENAIEKIWPRWQVDSILGKGSFGTVYKVVRKTFDQTFCAAVKCIHIPDDESQIREMQSDGLTRQEVSDYYKEAVQGLAGEISIMESLKGASNIVSIEDYEIEPDENGVGWNIYIRMELLENLNTFRQHNEMSTAQIVQMGIDICTALEYCARKNIIHRDIKPDNIFVSQFGQFKLGDFGISRYLEGTRATMSQKGTSTYMAPEVFRGERYDATVDTYSLGLVLYRLVNSGRMPFMPPVPAPIRYADMEAATNQRLSGCPLPPPTGCDPQLADILCKAAHPDPEKRYESPTAMKGALQEWMKHCSSIQCQPSPAKTDGTAGGNIVSDFSERLKDTEQTDPIDDADDTEHTVHMFAGEYREKRPGEKPGPTRAAGSESDSRSQTMEGGQPRAPKPQRTQDQPQPPKPQPPRNTYESIRAENVAIPGDEKGEKEDKRVLSLIFCILTCGFSGLALILWFLSAIS